MATASSSASLVLSAQAPALERNRALDGLRGVACLSVYACHTGLSVQLAPLVLYGWVGVHLFFVLSGYLIGKPFLRPLEHGKAFPSLKQYAIRRLIRIYPPYVVSLGVFLLLRRASGNKLPDATSFISHLVLGFNYFRSVDLFSINAVYWSLAVEAQFYVLLPLLALVIRFLPIRNHFAAAIGLVFSFLIVGVVARILELRWNGWIVAGITPVRFRTVFSFLDLFGFGMMAALLESLPAARRLVAPLRATGLAVGGIVLLLAANNWCAGQSNDWLTGHSDLFLAAFPVILCLGIGAIVLGILLGSPIRHVIAWRPLVWVGEISYSVYLYHLAVLVFLFRLFPMPWLHGWYTRGTTYTALGLAPTILVSWVMFELVERPSLRLVSRFRE